MGSGVDFEAGGSLFYSFQNMGLEPRKPNLADSLAAAPLKSVSAGESLDDATTRESGPQAPKFFSITQYNRSVERLLKTQVPQVWVKGVITQLNVRGKIAYLTLGEFEEGDARPRAVLEVTLWTSELEIYNLRFSQLPTPLALRVELKVALQLEANFYVPSGRFQPRVTGIDENFTLGELSLTRQRTLERLLKEGLLHKNKGLTLSDVPLRVGLITAPGSAAFHDFTTVLLHSGYSFQILLAGAKMQGEATEATVLGALEILGRKKLDVICIVRGGGAKTDLVYFDSENICRAIAKCPIPVLTGIGHEIDNSLSDLVAFANKITPTDCAKFLEEMLTACYARLCAYAGEISETWRMECQQSWHEMSQRASVLKHNWEGRQATETLRGREQARTLASLARQSLRAEGLRMASDLRGLLRGPRKILRLERLRFANRTQAMGHAWDRLNADSSQRLREAYLRLKDKSLLRTGGEGHRLQQSAERLECGARLEMDRTAAAIGPWLRMIKTWWRQGLRSGRESQQLKEKLIHAADPARLLGLGFSMLRTSEGKLVRSLAEVPENGILINQLKDGTVESRVIMKTKEKTAETSEAKKEAKKEKGSE